MVMSWPGCRARMCSDLSHRSTWQGAASGDVIPGPFAKGKGPAVRSAEYPKPPRIDKETKLLRAVSFGTLATAAALAIAGCVATSEPAPTVRPLMVQVPVLHETLCPVPVLAHPALPIAGLKPSSSPADTMRAYAAAVTILKGAVRERDAVLAGCAQTEPAARKQAENTQ